MSLKSQIETVEKDQSTVCVLCNQPISEEEMKTSESMHPQGRAHSGCYYEGLGELIEENPIPRS